MTNDNYEFAAWTWQMDDLHARNLIASNCSDITSRGVSLAQLDDAALRSAFESVRAPEDTGFAHIDQAYQNVRRANHYRTQAARHSHAFGVLVT
jgi:methionine synthase II (cobalamin-independent)